MVDTSKRKYAVFDNELDDLVGLYKDSAAELVSKIQKRGELGDAVWRRANPWDGDLGGFLANELQSTRNFLPPGFFRLRQGLWGNTRETKTIYLRDWYIQTATEIVSSFEEEEDLSLCILAASGGMGKSVFGFVLLLQALYKGLNVTYQRGTKRFWIVADQKPQDRDDGNDYAVLETFEKFGYSEALIPGVYRVKSAITLFDKLSKLSNVLHIVDLDDSVECDVHPSRRTVVISSPNSISKLMMRDPKYKYMPCWTLEELKTLNEKLPEGDMVPKPLYHKVTAEVLKDLYDKFGGVPQVIFKNESVGKKYRTLQETIQETPLEVLRKALNTHSYSRLSNTVPSLLLNVKGDPNDPEDCRVEFVSEFIMSAVADYHGLESPEKYFSVCGEMASEDKSVQL